MNDSITGSELIRLIEGTTPSSHLLTNILVAAAAGEYAPKGFRTEDGDNPGLGKKYGLVEHHSWSYTPRTELNVKESDSTVLFGDLNSSGSRQTIQFCKKHGKVHFGNPNDGDDLRKWIMQNNIQVLNVAGNRGSKLTTAQVEGFKQILREALQ